MAATVDQVSGGRFALGTGAGWQINEHEQVRHRAAARGARIDRLAETLQVLRWAKPTNCFRRRALPALRSDALCKRNPVQDPLLILVHYGDHVPRITAWFADEWRVLSPSCL
jgi:alkanesulfonate monooxygenase SsuD/methylene tetrahydromethanopterin reductase-like flavin-dependent oxidoreductase (luciferase family)